MPILRGDEVQINSKSSRKPKPTAVNEPDTSDETELIGADAKLFRSIAATLNYMSIDRPDIQYAVKETARMMARPRACDWKPLKKIARYLIRRPRLALIYKWQKRQSQIDGYTDSDWAGCPASCKSTSGGALMIGRHLLKTYSRQQKTIALSSAEAELYGMSACSSELLGMQACAADLGIQVKVSIYADASAALGIVQRRGIGRVRHVKTQSLWLQEAHAQRRIAFEKVDGSRNPADLLTKHVPELLLDRHLAYLSCVPEDGRAVSAPTLSSLGLNTLPLFGFSLDTTTPGNHPVTATTTSTTSKKNNNNNNKVTCSVGWIPPSTGNRNDVVVRGATRRAGTGWIPSSSAERLSEKGNRSADGNGTVPRTCLTKEHRRTLTVKQRPLMSYAKAEYEPFKHSDRSPDSRAATLESCRAAMSTGAPRSALKSAERPPMEVGEEGSVSIDRSSDAARSFASPERGEPISTAATCGSARPPLSNSADQQVPNGKRQLVVRWADEAESDGEEVDADFLSRDAGGPWRSSDSNSVIFSNCSADSLEIYEHDTLFSCRSQGGGVLNYAYDITQRQQKEAERKRSEKKKMHLRMQIDRSAIEQMSKSAQSSISSRRFESHSELSHSMHMCVRVQEVDLQSDFERETTSLSHT